MLSVQQAAATYLLISVRYDEQLCFRVRGKSDNGR